MSVVSKWDIDLAKIEEMHNLDKAQAWLDNEVIKHMDPYTPFMNGGLQQAIRMQTVIGSGHLVQDTPYARVMYYGVIMVDPLTGLAGRQKLNGQWYSRVGVKKVPAFESDKRMASGRPIHFNYNRTRSSKAGAFWFQRMKADKSQDLGRGLAKLTGGVYMG